MENKVYNERTKQLLEEEMSNFPGNLRACFRVVAETVGTSWQTIENGYYNKKGCPFHKSKIAKCFCIIGNNSTINSKSYQPEKNISTETLGDKVNFLVETFK